MKLSYEEADILGKFHAELKASFIVVDASFCIKYINTYALKKFHFKEKTVSGLSFISLSRKYNLQVFDTEGKLNVNPVRINHQSRKWYLVEGTLVDETAFFILDKEVIDAEDLIPAMAQSVTAITGQVFKKPLAAHQYIDEVKNYFKGIINKIPCYVYWKNKNLEYMGCNELAANFVHFKSTDEIIGKTDFDIFSDPVLAKSYRDDDLQILSTGKPILNVPGELADDKGKYFSTLVSKVPLTNESGEIIGIVGITLDVTKEKQAEIAKSDFISNMEHDLKTPFSGIGGIANFLYDMETDETKKEFLSLMVKSCNQWEQVHNRIFDALDVEQSQGLQMETVSISNELSEIKDMMAATVYMKKIGFEVAPVPDELDKIQTDRVKFRLILSSLISNAINFTEQGIIKVLTSQEGDGFKIQVTDTGIGIPPDKQEYIFERFAKLSRSNKYGGDFKGLGLGLYVCREYAKQLGASIQVESKLGEGSTFTIHFSG